MVAKKSSRVSGARLGAIGLLIGLGALTVAAIVAIFPVTASDAGPPRGEWSEPFRLIDPPEPVPATGFTLADGTALDLSAFRGRVVLLNFWATWCGPCVREMPTLDRLEKALGGDDFEVVAVSTDRGGLKQVEPWWRRLGLEHMTIYLDRPGRLANGFEVRVMPTTVLIDRDGRVVMRHEGTSEWDAPDVVAFIEWFLSGE